MKGFKILNNAFISILTTSLSGISLVNKKYRVAKINKENERLQKIMSLNYQIYGVHILEEDTFLYKSIEHIKKLEEPGQPPLFEEIEVEGDLKKMRDDFFEKALHQKISEQLPSELADMIKDAFARRAKRREEAQQTSEKEETSEKQEDNVKQENV